MREEGAEVVPGKKIQIIVYSDCFMSGKLNGRGAYEALHGLTGGKGLLSFLAWPPAAGKRRGEGKQGRKGNTPQVLIKDSFLSGERRGTLDAYDGRTACCCAQLRHKT